MCSLWDNYCSVFMYMFLYTLSFCIHTTDFALSIIVNLITKSMLSAEHQKCLKASSTLKLQCISQVSYAPHMSGRSCAFLLFWLILSTDLLRDIGIGFATQNKFCIYMARLCCCSHWHKQKQRPMLTQIMFTAFEWRFLDASFNWILNNSTCRFV